ncbi:hypothetical protein D3C76_699930 [compost metagenome]
MAGISGIAASRSGCLKSSVDGQSVGRQVEVRLCVTAGRGARRCCNRKRKTPAWAGVRHHSSRKDRRCSLRVGWRNLRNAFASI